ncbi:hypothetical protein [Nocardiopsis sp. HUAS JQ3]|uniref:hypothetical protein n=1 Tax=Nocardiopsis sp. HUAS JQ3 TaxID=3061629 RepID=UPI0023A9CB33|nr:hypothetical protein [Nocardiopsis sp. HUAS JQ3]WDZ89048.1 hypothetical protein PV789_19050 [Nocardiopsis sp. HUAS JQ3]
MNPTRHAVGAGPAQEAPAGREAASPDRSAARRRAARNTATFARLTWFNTLRLARNPVLVPGVLVGLYLLVAPDWAGRSGTLEGWYDNANSTASAVGAMLFAVVAFPAMREARYSPRLVSPLGRTGRLLALMAASSLVSTALVVLWAGVDHWLSPPLLGTLSPSAYPAPLLLAAAGPLLSIALVAWTRSYLPLIVALLALPAYWLYGVSAVDANLSSAVLRVEWAARVALDPFNVSAPSVTDVTTVYLVYSVLVVALLAVLAVAARGRRAHRAACLGAAAVLLAATVGTVVHGRQTQPLYTPIPDSRVYGAQGPPCQTREGVTYCPLPGFEPWVERWHGALGPALDLLPEVPPERMPVVWQESFSYHRELDVPRDRGVVVHAYTDGWDHYWQTAMVGEAARVVLGLPDPYETECLGTGQARVLLAAWLAAGVEGMSRYDTLDTLAANLYAYRPSPVDLELSLAMADLPEERVSRVLERNWERLTDPRTTSLELARLLDTPLRESSTGPAGPGDWRRLYPQHQYHTYEEDPGRYARPVCG